MNKRLLLRAIALIAPLLVLSNSVHAANKLKVVASFSILGDMARQVGGDRVEVSTLVGANGDTHVFQPAPGHVKIVAAANVLIINGLGFEGWISRLEKSAGFKGAVVVATTGIAPHQMEEEENGKQQKVIDPHAWQSLANGKIYVRNIRDALIAADPFGKATYEANANKFLSDIDRLDAEVKANVAKLPSDRRRVITSHDAFGYFATSYGLEFIAPQGVNTESEASAKDVASIIRQIKTQKIPAIFLENISDHRLLDQIARETSAKVGGTLYSDALSDSSGPAATYLDMFRHNTRTLMAALSS
ncbi:MAG: metal ABC transporter substrate-binding protein [Gammaproteobacteria bacterium]|nr:metal ABC transporter substrate-binding protein [Gammaproteobacteria bacterium]